MNLQKTLLATVAGGITLFVLGYVIYVLLFNNPEFTHGTNMASVRSTLAFPYIIIMELAYGFLIAYVLGKWAGVTTFNGGLKAGAVLGLLVGLCNGLHFFAITELFNEASIIWDAVTWAIRWAVAGGVVGLVLGSGK